MGGTRRAALTLLLATMTCSLVVALPAAATGHPKVSPLPGGTGTDMLGDVNGKLAQAGYTAAEFEVSGDAAAYGPVGGTELSRDGKWRLEKIDTKPYATRVVIARPDKPADFDGTVYVEWLNTTAGRDSAPDWRLGRDEIVAEGAAWVGVSAQVVGVIVAKADEPAVYGQLDHPGDSYSYDIYSQVARLIRGTPDQILGDLKPKHLIATGVSQSALGLATYINALGKRDDVYDGYYVHSRGGYGLPLSSNPLPQVQTPPGLLIRTDLDAPVLQFDTETDVITAGGVDARQPDTDRLRLWEVAGTAHADAYGVAVAGQWPDRPTLAKQMLAVLTSPPMQRCTVPINAGPHMWVDRAAIHALARWVEHGKAPPRGARLETSDAPASLLTDANGNARGGIRTPYVDAPVAVLSGLGQSGAGCTLYGTTEPFSPEQVQSLYPARVDLVAAWKESARAAQGAGFLLPADARALVAAVETASVPGLEAPTG